MLDLPPIACKRLRVDAVVDEALATITDVGDTASVDTTALHEVDYVYRVVVQAAGKELKSGGLAHRLSLLPAEITSLEFDSRTASATITWTEHEGPHFLRYEVHRRVAGGASELVRQALRPEQSKYTDPGLHGNQFYQYRIRTVTTRSETIIGGDAAGRLHEVEGTWPLDLPEDAFVRLYNEGPDRISALVSTEDAVRLWQFDTDGNLLEEQLVHDMPVVFGRSPPIVPESVSIALGEGGRRFLAMGQRTRALVLELTGDGETLYRDTTLFEIELPNNFATVSGASLANIEADGFAEVVFDNLQTSTVS